MTVLFVDRVISIFICKHLNPFFIFQCLKFEMRMLYRTNKFHHIYRIFIFYFIKTPMTSSLSLKTIAIIKNF